MSISWGQLNDILTSRANRNKVPLTGQFELTSRCNLRCKMCYVCTGINDRNSLDKELSAEEWINLAGQARDSGMLYLLLTGGEVFIREDFKTIYQEISSMGLVTQIYSNGTLITPETVKWLGKIPPSKVGITLYGASAAVYNDLCGDPEGFGRARRGVELLLAEGITVELRTTATKHNAGDFEQLAEYADKLGVEFGIVNYVSPRRDIGSTKPEDIRLSPTELADYERCVEDYFASKTSAEKSKQAKNRFFLNSVYNEQNNIRNMDTNEEKATFRCTAGRSSFWVTSKGIMTACMHMESPTILPREKGFANAWAELTKFCSEVPVCEKCLECNLKEYCMTCPARLASEAGTFSYPAEYLCESAKARYALSQKMKD